MTSLHTVDWDRLPPPEDDGGADHLVGARLPDLTLKASHGGAVNVGALNGRVVIYAYPMTGRPDRDLPAGWDAVPGARGCTPQACAFRDHAAELARLGVDAVLGVSTQAQPDQAEAAERLHLPFALLSDSALKLARAIRLPTFTHGRLERLKRLTLIVEDGEIVRVFYPVFPPDQAPEQVIKHLRG